MAKTIKSLRALFEEASEIQDARARAAFLDDECAGDVALRANVEELLQAEETVGGFLADLEREPLVLAGPKVEQAGDRIGRYKLLQKIGEGGCGIVYMAEQFEPVRRRVALKVIKLGMDTASMIARFEAERQALALMDHPGIARVLDAGATDVGRPYFVMELVRGTKITEFCEQKKLSIAERLRLFIQVCQAVQHAHQKGVIHRDLKPSNVLVTANDGVLLPKVIDFGIAKATADIRLTDKTVFTRFEMFLGTPAYMSPEQADSNADDVDTRTDIYSLGVLLYELLTGRPPFESETLLKSGIDALRKTIREREPTRPSTRLAMELKSVAAARKSAPNSDEKIDGDLRISHSNIEKETIAQLRGDLDWIVLKALDKDRRRRYETANSFGEDIQRHLRHEPVQARPPNPLYLLQKSLQRNRSAFVIAAATVLLLVAGVIFETREVMRTRRAEARERELRQKAQTSQQQAELGRNEADAANRILSGNLFIREWLDSENLLDEGKITSALTWFARAARQHPKDAAVQTRLLSLLSERTFVVSDGQPLAHGSPVNNFAFLSDGRLATAAMDGKVRLWQLNSHSAPLILSNVFQTPAVASGPRPNLVLVDDARSVSLWDLNGLVKAVPFSHEVNQRLPISVDGHFAAIYGPENGYRVWDIAELKPMGPLIEGTRTYPSATGFSPDGKYILGVDKGGQLAAWDVAKGRLVWQKPNTPHFQGVAFVEAEVHPEGKTVIVSYWLGTAGGELAGYTFEPSLSPDAARVTALSESWNLHTRSVIGTWCFSKDGKQLFVGDAEGHLGIVDLTTHDLRILNAEHDGRITWMGLSNDGQRLASASTDGSVRLWDVRMKSADAVVITNGTSVWDAKFSPDSRWFVCSGSTNAELRDARSGALLKRLSLNQFVTHVDVSPDGRRVVACGERGRTIVWDAESGAPLFSPIQSDPADYVEFSRDGRWFLIMSSRARTEVHETETGRQIGPTLTNSTRGVMATFDTTGRSLVVANDNGTIEFWSLPDGRRITKPSRHKDVVWTAYFSPDGTQLLTSSRDRTAALWGADTGNLIREFRHEQPLYTATFSPDGARIVTGDAGRKAHVWDAKTGKRLFSLPTHPGGVWYAEFSSNGQVLLTGDDLGNARLWEASSGLPLNGWVHNGSSLRRTHLSADGEMALSAAESGTVRIWPVMIAPLPSPTWLPELAEALAGRRLRQDGAPEPVSADQWNVLESSLSSLEGDDFYARWARWFFLERLKEHPAPFVP